MKNNLGMSVMLKRLSGNEETYNAYHDRKDKQILSVVQEGERLVLSFDDGKKLIIWDDGQSCCESRYMRTDDNLSEFKDCTLLDIELKNAPSLTKDDDYGEHEVQFLEVKTSKGSFVMSSHNEHNGYYGGFAIELRVE